MWGEDSRWEKEQIENERRSHELNYFHRRDFVNFEEWWNIYKNNTECNKEFCMDAWNAALDAAAKRMKI